MLENHFCGTILPHKNKGNLVLMDSADGRGVLTISWSTACLRTNYIHMQPCSIMFGRGLRMVCSVYCGHLLCLFAFCFRRTFQSATYLAGHTTDIDLPRRDCLLSTQPTCRVGRSVNLLGA
eukprot:2811956-Amphidinium_carterae.2